MDKLIQSTILCLQLDHCLLNLHYAANLPYRRIHHCLELPCYRHIQDDTNRDRYGIANLVLIPYS